MLRILFRHFFLVIFLLVLFWPKISFSANTPFLTIPANNDSVSKNPKLSWEYGGECPKEVKCFRVELDNNQDFSSTDKSIYTDSTSYSPRGLSAGVWYWRVRARENSDKWGDWSNVFSFNIGEDKTINDNSESKTTENKTMTKFEIKDLKSEINSDQEVEVIVLIEGDKPNSQFHIKGAFRKDDSINYFGETYFENGWSKNNSTYSKQPIIKTDNEGVWTGKIKIRPDREDSGFKGTGDYNFKVGKYTDSGNGPVWSNELRVKIIETLPSPSPSPLAEEETLEEEIIKEELTLPIPSFDADFKIASVAGEATKSDNISNNQALILEERKVNWLLLFLGSGLLVCGISYGIYLLKSKQITKRTPSRN